jgi:hypothetical protein
MKVLSFMILIGSDFQPPKTSNKDQAITEMKENRWRVVNGKTLCHNCR